MSHVAHFKPWLHLESITSQFLFIFLICFGAHYSASRDQKMLRSTYAAPPPLPPGWTEHRAPSGPWSSKSSRHCTNKPQVIYITTIRKPNSPLIPDRKHLLLPLNRSPNRCQMLLMPLRSIRRNHCRLFPQRLTALVGLDLGMCFPVIAEGVFGAARATKTADGGALKTGRKRNILYPDVHHGFW